MPAQLRQALKLAYAVGCKSAVHCVRGFQLADHPLDASEHSAEGRAFEPGLAGGRRWPGIGISCRPRFIDPRTDDRGGSVGSQLVPLLVGVSAVLTQGLVELNELSREELELVVGLVERGLNGGNQQSEHQRGKSYEHRDDEPDEVGRLAA